MSYALLENGRAIRCNQCGRTSWNLNDVRNRYCGYCHTHHDDVQRYTVPSDWNNRDNRVDVFPAPGDTWNMENGSSVTFGDAPAASSECSTPDPTPTVDFGSPDCSPSSTDSGGWSDV